MAEFEIDKPGSIAGSSKCVISNSVDTSKDFNIQYRAYPKEKVEVNIIEPKIIDLEYQNHPLFPVFMAAIEQATKGKGVRHGGDETPFLEQPWAHYAQLHGRGFLTGQAAKKLEEAASIKSGDAFINEALGAMIYIAMSVIYEQQKEKDDDNLG